MKNEKPMLTIGVFYDGQYFFKVSNYYAYQHERKARIAIGGLHNFIRRRVADTFHMTFEDCSIVDAHYFRGRLPAREASNSNALYNERVFDDILTSEGITTHYLPIQNIAGKRQEKGIDVWLALEAYEQTIAKGFDIAALIVCDGDYIPLVRKLNALGTRVLLLCWNLKYRDENGEDKEIKTSQDLFEAVNYPIRMHDLIETSWSEDNPLFQDFFIGSQAARAKAEEAVAPETAQENGGLRISEIVSLNKGYGFIKEHPNNIFFHYTGLASGDFYDLYRGDKVRYRVMVYDHKPVAVDVEKIEAVEGVPTA